MAKLSASTSPSSGRRTGKKGGAVAFGTIVAILVVTGAIIALTTPSKESGSSPLSMLFADAQCTEPCVPGSEEIMKPKAHGSSEYPVVSTVQ